MQDKILREYVRLLVETGEDEFGYLYGSYDDLYRMFIKPFVDVAEVAAGEVGKTAARLETLVKVTFEAIVSSLIPILSADYKEIFDKEKEKIDAWKISSVNPKPTNPGHCARVTFWRIETK
jgi:hypothetical protein